MKFKNLYEFIDIAEKNRKYLPNTATNYRTPLRLVESELTDEEKNSIDLVKTHLNEIFSLLYSKNSDKLTASSLEVYKRRVRSLISDYEEYGEDPAKMAAWDRNSQPKKSKKAKGLSKKEIDRSEENDTSTALVTSSSVEVGEFSLILPSDWDIIKTRQAIARGDFKTIFDELTKLSPNLKKTENKVKDLDSTSQG